MFKSNKYIEITFFPSILDISCLLMMWMDITNVMILVMYITNDSALFMSDICPID